VCPSEKFRSVRVACSNTLQSIVLRYVYYRMERVGANRSVSEALRREQILLIVGCTIGFCSRQSSETRIWIQWGPRDFGENAWLESAKLLDLWLIDDDWTVLNFSLDSNSYFLFWHMRRM